MSSETPDLKISPETIETQIELIAREFFTGKDMSQASPISYGELVWLMRKLMSAVVAVPTPPVPASQEIPLEPCPDHSQLVNQLWESDAACALTNQAARAIEKLSTSLQQALNERNAAISQLKEVGITIT